MKNWGRFKDTINRARNIVITTHIHPDADGIGSQLALMMALKKLNKKVICLNENSLATRYQYLDKNGSIISFAEFGKKKFSPIDLLIVVDAHSLDRIGPNMNRLAKNTKEIFFIDHHPSPPEISAIHLIDQKMAASGQLVGTIIKKLNIPFTKEMALPLYTSILVDTSSFRYPSINGDTHRLIGALLDTGIKSPEAYNSLYGAKKIKYMHLLGELLGNAKSAEDQKIAWITLPQKLLIKYNVDSEDTHAFINHLLILENIKVAVMFREMKNYVKISMRSVTHDVGNLAQALGGGGHYHSAAAVREGKLNKIVKETIEKIKIILKS